MDIDNTKIELNDDNKNLIKKINLPNLLNIIFNNLFLLNEKENIESIKTVNSTKLIIYIILLISNYYEEKEKTEIYKKFFENQKNILFNCTLYEISDNVFIMSIILFPLMNEEKNGLFMKLQNEEVYKYLKDYKKLNSIKGDVMSLFDLFIELYDIYKNIQNDEMFELFEYILNIILDNNIIIKNIMIEGYLYVLNKILNILKENKYEHIFKYNFDNLISKFINGYLIKFETDKINIITELDNSDDNNNFIIITIYEILSLIIELNPEKYIQFFFENEGIKNLREKYLTNLPDDKIKYSPEEEFRKKYVGLFNPAALCYINSVIQLFFMLPLFQTEILSLPIDKNLNPDLDNDDFLFQLQKMFYNLKYSSKKYYNPKSFVISFKDSQGKSPDFNEQCDAQEFLLRFIEKINESLKNTKYKYLCENIVGGNTLQKVKCTNPECGNVSERRDNINYLSLEIKNKNKLRDCLNGFIAEEKIEDYHCEKCDKKITHIKQVLIDQIPNILIIHLQRFVFNYTYFTMEKLNSPLTFEENLNIKNYTVDKDNEDIPLDYFDYELKGALIHTGEHEYGHYYTLIYNKKEKKFCEFNDMNINNIDFDKGKELATGTIGEKTNAYMLIYEKKNKNPVIINNKNIDENIKKILEEKNDLDKIESTNGKIYYVYENEKEAIKKNINNNNDINIKDIIIKNDKSQAELVTYDEALNILIKENEDSYETKPFIKKIISENIKLKNDANFYIYAFTSFINKISQEIKNEIMTDETKQKIIKYTPILKILNDYIMHIISISKEKEEFPSIVNNLTDIYEYSKNEELLSFLIKYFDQIKENIYNNYLVSKDRTKGVQIGKYIAKTIDISINNNLEMDLANNVIKYFMDKIPVEITKKWLDMESFNEFVYQLIENSDIIKRNFIKNKMISKLIDFILGKSSPFYKCDERKEFINTKGYFEPIIKSIALLFHYYENNISDEDLVLSPDDITLINYNNFYEKILKDNYETKCTNLLLDNKLSLTLALNIKENKSINDVDILDFIINKRLEKVKTKEEIISYLELLINLIKKYSLLYLNKDNEIFNEKLNILLGLPIPIVNSGDAEIKYISGKYYGKNTILTTISKEQNIDKDIIKLLNLIFDLLNINNLVFNYVDNLPAPNSLKYSYVDYLLTFYLTNKEELEKIKHDEKTLNKLSESFNDIIKKYNKINLDNISIKDKLYFSDFSYVLKSNENLKLYKMKIKYQTLKEPKKTNLDCFNKTTFFSNINKDNKMEEEPKEENKGDNLDNLICLLVFCHADLDISIEFKPYFNSKLEIKGKKNIHYIFYCFNEEKGKEIDYSKIKVQTNEIVQPNQQQENQNLSQGMKFQLNIPSGLALRVTCEVCGTQNIITNQVTELKCSFCECPLMNIKFNN